MYQYLNLNPLGRRVNDCTVRAMALATGNSWDKTYRELSEYAQKLCIMPDEVEYIDLYLEENFEKICGCKENPQKITVGEFIKNNPYGIYLITMSGHITCAIDGCIYDTFDPRERYVWGAYKVK